MINIDHSWWYMYHGKSCYIHVTPFFSGLPHVHLSWPIPSTGSSLHASVETSVYRSQFCRDELGSEALGEIGGLGNEPQQLLKMMGSDGIGKDRKTSLHLQMRWKKLKDFMLMINYDKLMYVNLGSGMFRLCSRASNRLRLSKSRRLLEVCGCWRLLKPLNGIISHREATGDFPKCCGLQGILCPTGDQTCSDHLFKLLLAERTQELREIWPCTWEQRMNTLHQYGTYRCIVAWISCTSHGQKGTPQPHRKTLKIWCGLSYHFSK